MCSIDYVRALCGLLLISLVLRRLLVVISPLLKTTVSPKLVGQGTIVVGVAGE